MVLPEFPEREKERCTMQCSKKIDIDMANRLSVSMKFESEELPFIDNEQ
jgi:hypothetical protein